MSVSGNECLRRAYHSQKGKISKGIDGAANDEVLLDIDTAGSHLRSKFATTCLPKHVDRDTLKDRHDYARYCKGDDEDETSLEYAPKLDDWENTIHEA